MFRTQLENWGAYNKKLSPDEVLLMARVEAQRKKQGAGSEFWRYSRRVSKPNFERYLRDHPHTASKLRAWLVHDHTMEGYIEAILPPHIVVLTPPRSLNLGDELHSIESTLFTIRNYISLDPSVESMMPFSSAKSLTQLVPLVLGGDYSPPRPSRLNSEASPFITRHFNDMKTILQEENPSLLVWLMLSYLVFILCRLKEVTRLWLFQARDLCFAIKGLRHPLSEFIRALLTFSDGEAPKHLYLIKASLEVIVASLEVTGASCREVGARCDSHLCLACNTWAQDFYRLQHSRFAKSIRAVAFDTKL